MELIEKAKLFAIESHKGVFRKFNNEPYSNHPIRVAKIVTSVSKIFSNIFIKGEIKYMTCAAYLHDTIEDVDHVDYELIKKEFGKTVADLVDELTSDDKKIKEMGKTNYLIDKMSTISNEALLVKLADRLDNCSDLEIATKKFKNTYTKSTKKILDGIMSNRELMEYHDHIISYIQKKLEF